MLTISLGLRTGSFGNSAYFYELSADELGLDLRLAVFEKHCQNLAQVRIQLVERPRLRVCAGEARDKADEESGFRRAFDDSGNLESGQSGTWG